MSESAANVKRFFFPSLHTIALADTLQATEAEDRALLGSNPSADFGDKTGLGFSES